MAAPAYTEVAPSPQPEWYEDQKGTVQFRAKRFLKCAWTDSRALIDWLYSEAGASYPHADGVVNAFVRGIKPIARGRTGGTSSLISHSEAIFEVRYDTAGPKWVNGSYIQESLHPARFTVSPPGKLWWEDGVRLTEEEVRFNGRDHSPREGAGHLPRKVGVQV